MATRRRAGLLQVSVNGVRYDMMGDWTYNLGLPKKETLIGPDAVHGHKETPQASFIEGKVLDSSRIKIRDLNSIEGATVVLMTAVGPDGEVGKTIVFTDAWNATEGNVSANNGEIDVRFESAYEARES